MTAELPEPAAPGSPVFRASHAEREAVVERLQDAAAEGRLDFAELDVRLEKALNAKDQGELSLLVADLPPAAGAGPGEPLDLKGGMHGVVRTGAWKVPALITVNAGMGGAVLDFTRVSTRLPEVEIRVKAKTGGVKMIVPEGWAVDTDRVDPSMGGVRNRTTAGEPAPGTPLIRVTGSAGMGGVVVRHPNAWERRKLKRELES
ncbi:DUF1707 and DUF2154 domain-containing protein [Streptomyces sp. AV19]|uniref:DUF1707 SHOCT-like domain-containing protein n=1 Tax=Streptomyces sp. AV19 TaxID=2793068 RepID=UPI0018FE940B|nr:DUF1707 domain-containing protein [Streptomyces sp. AV19]MBH1933018.1 DUF1707 and DUF2154 domain-containing protein [Streptomyces sp. AV19]MDG4531731.1 DUF1707 domain-containing protein [Streptomyces sp. AV19]